MIGARSTVSSADVKAVMDNLNFILDMELRAGRIVQLGEFGNFRLSLSSNGASDKKSFSQADVKGARVIFTPGASCVIPKAGRLHLYRKERRRRQRLRGGRRRQRQTGNRVTRLIEKFSLSLLSR